MTWLRELWCGIIGHDFHFRRPDGSWGALKCWFCGRDYEWPRDSVGKVSRYCDDETHH